MGAASEPPPPDSPTVPSEPGESSAAPVGNYRLVRKLGQGGMGEVWEAMQLRPIRRRVALKLIRRGMDSREVVARFETERQALALMDHPNIAKVFDAGTTPDGGPYFVMEFVPGIPITAHCDRNRLDVAARLRLFRHACDGVQHAHQKAILHRDLKPSNILVAVHEGRAEPKIIDFGVAKAMARPLSEHTLLTELGQLIGTPEYMSPEQAEMSNQGVDTRTDVYSLGVVLYELLVGALPFDGAALRQAPLDEIRRTIRETDPPRPSTRLGRLGGSATTSAHNRHTTPRELLSELSGDLDWIVMKALEKDPARRYASPADLAADLERHLTHLPVAARPPELGYRAGKFVRRHRTGVAAGAAVVLALVAGVIATSWGLVRARRAEEAARREAAVATQVSDFLVELFAVTDPRWGQGQDLTARQIVDRGAADVRRKLDDQPRLKARLLGTIGAVYRNIGSFAEARSLLDEALVVHRGAGPDAERDVATDLTNLALVDRSEGRYESAEQRLREALALRQGSRDPDEVGIARTVFNLGSLLWDRGRYAESESLVVVAQGMFEAAEGDHREDLATCLGNLSNFAVGRGELQRALGLRRESLRLLREVHGNEHPLIATALVLAAGFGEDPAGDEACFREALSIHRKVYGDEHPETLQTRINFAEHWLRFGNADSAEVALRDVLAIAGRGMGPDHPLTITATVDLGWAYRARGDYAAAEHCYREAMERRRRTLGPAHPYTIRSMWQVARLLCWQGRYAAAEDITSRALATARAALDPREENLAYTLLYHGMALLGEGRPARAEPVLREAATALGEGTENRWDAVYAGAALGASLAGQGKAAEAESLLAAAGEHLLSTREAIAPAEKAFVRRELVALYGSLRDPAAQDRWRAALAH